ncbi:MAG TPA: uroporphyrinogen decarboxylase [Candidatus Binatia bacterium]|nr:uroporphyrinogen decarboxylase [Candidatus Binatia bacterium]
MTGAAAAAGARTGRQRILAALRRQPVDCTPVWFMRQAGRALAGYRELRERFDILTITRTPELCARVTLMPVSELGVDAAVLYADIMLPLIGMGVPFTIDPGVGPIVHQPVRTAADIARLQEVGSAEDATPDLFTAIRLVRRELGEGTAVIGFAGGPFTVASYMIEGRPSRDHALSKALMHGRPELWDHLMEILSRVTIRYLRAQVAAGVDAVQLFDSWVGALSRRDYESRVLPHVSGIFEGVADLGVPRLHFGTGCSHLLESMAGAGSEAISVDWRLPLDEAWQRIGPHRGIQGNLDPTVLLAPWPVVARETRRVLGEAGGRDGHVFNLGHGVLPGTEAATLRRVVDLVHQETARP